MRRRTRRLVRPRVFNNARTASRNRDLAIRDPPLIPSSFLLHGRILASARRQQQQAFWSAAGFFYVGV